MKKKKLNLNDLKVESFVTSLDSEDRNTVKGGADHIEHTDIVDCHSIVYCSGNPMGTVCCKVTDDPGNGNSNARCCYVSHNWCPRTDWC